MPLTIDAPNVVDKSSEVVKKPAPRYRVLLHNDDHNFPEYVALCLMEVAQLSEQEAIHVMFTAHTTGVGLVKICDIEPAEFYCEGLKSKGLTSTIEPEE
jgi:ATP-dependent Clp protease adaptor protein ClpS